MLIHIVKGGVVVSNIVVLMGSVRKGGNTEKLVTAFAKGAR